MIFLHSKHKAARNLYNCLQISWQILYWLLQFYIPYVHATRDVSCIQALVMIQISLYSSIRLKIAKQENLSKNSHQPKLKAFGCQLFT